MEKKLNQMVSSKFLIIWLLLYCLGLTSCCRTKSIETDNTNYPKKTTLNSDSKEVRFLPDSTVNNILILQNAESFKRFYSAISSENYIDFLRESPVLGFINKDSNEYLLLYQYEGGIKNAFSCFEIGNMSNIQQAFTATNYKKFETESGLMLGMLVDDLIRIKGESYKKEKDKIIYQITDYTNSNFLKNYNMPAYFLECTLKEKKIVKIKFGFDYP